MTPDEKIVKQVVALLRQRGQKALELSKKTILNERIEYAPLREALQYFIDEVWLKVLHPGLLSVYCEAVGGDPDETTQIGASMVLLVGAADIHDDVIDQSTMKDHSPTIFGKFGKDIAVLAGDALLIEGVYLLFAATARFPESKRTKILGLIKQAFFDLSSAEAYEASYRGRLDMSGKVYLEIIKRKVAVAEATAKIGAILGEGTANEIEILGDYGHTLGLLLTIRDEFIDVFEPNELANRNEKEILPLPILYTFENPERREKIVQLLKDKLTQEKTEKILDIVMEANETHQLKKEMKRLVSHGVREVASLEACRNILDLLLQSTIEDLK